MAMANMAVALSWFPESLYNMSISTVVSNYSDYKKDLKLLPDSVKFDLHYELYNQSRLCELSAEFRKLEVFTKMLKITDKRHLLHHCFQALMDHGSHLSEVLSHAYMHHCNQVLKTSSVSARDEAIHMGFALGGFLNDAGWFKDCEKVMAHCLSVCKATNDLPHWVKSLECCIRLLHVRNAFCKFDEAYKTYLEAQRYVNKLRQVSCVPNLAALYTELSLLLFVKSHYDEAYQWSVLAMKELSADLPPKTIIDVLRQAAKACVVKREFKRSELLIKQAAYMAREYFGCRHPKYSDTLVDYGFYLLNIDCVAQSVQVYQNALAIRQCVFGGKNLHIAITHEDLAYASYVNEYSTGKFQSAHQHADRAMEIMCSLLPPDHLLLSSSKRVKALILEEIAIDTHDKIQEQQQLLEAQELHLSALALAKKAFGEMNVQTAKHYGNLGRLYQSMRYYEVAEEMHLKAISIKEKLLGPEDYEVALSVGHLASLYNYDMNKYEEAKELYLRSIAIGKKLFGEGYSGLEYDYRGLIRVYNKLCDYDKINEYNAVYHRWKQLRDCTEGKQGSQLRPNQKPLPLEQVVQQFFEMEPSIQCDHLPVLTDCQRI